MLSHDPRVARTPYPRVAGRIATVQRGPECIAYYHMEGMGALHMRRSSIIAVANLYREYMCWQITAGPRFGPSPIVLASLAGLGGWALTAAHSGLGYSDSGPGAL